MAEIVYILCALTSALCALLLFRGYRRHRLRLLIYVALCFVGLTLNNVLLCVDLLMVPELDLRAWRASVALVALSILVVGLVWDSP